MKIGTFITMIFLILVALAHLYRAALEVPVLVGKYQIPLWMSWIAVLITLVLAISVWSEHRKNR